MLILWIIIITFNLNLNNDAQGPGKPYINDDNKCYRNKNFFFLKIHRIGKHVISDNLGN